MCKKLIYLILFVLVLGLAQGQARGSYLAAWWDGDYPTNWADETSSVAVRDALEAAGYEILDSAQLKTWMDARIADGVSSVVVFCRDIAPDTVVETNTADCTLRKYLDAGGKIVFYADIPFWNQGQAGGGMTGWSASGATGILGFNAASATWDSGNTVTITDEGIEWGLTETWASVRPTSADNVDIVLATDAGGNAAAWVKFFEDNTSGGFVRIRDAGGMPNVDDLMRVAEYGLGGNPFPRSPSPKDGAMLEDTWVNLIWRAGDFAVSQDVYLGDNFDDVNDGTGDTFRGNQAATNLIIGFPGFLYPDGLVPGTTYYWRIDEVNDLDPNSPWKGPVWSFWITPYTAYNPTPADGAKFVDPDVELSWTAGFGAKLHTVYFGDNFDDVNDGVIGIPQPTTTYTPGTLEPKKTYYWRVDEFDVVTTHKGDVWSFTTAGAGGGLRGEYYHWDDPSVGGGGNPGPVQPFVTLVLTRIDPQINFPWGDGSPDPSINADDFSVIWTGEVEAVFTETYTFYTSTDDGARLWINDQQIIDQWIEQGTTEVSGTIDLVAGQTYPIVMEYYENGGGAVAELRWSSPRTPKQLIPQGALSLPVKARSPEPSNGATDVTQTATLSWKPGEAAASHQVYFGTDEEAVRNADTTSPEYKGIKALGSESYDPGKLPWDTTYYWRVDEVNNLNPDSPWVGNLWSFTTADFLWIEDFEDYNDYEPYRIYETWIDGWGTTTNGSTAGYPDPNFDQGEHFVEVDVVHGGAQSMPLFYDNNFKYSEATLTLVWPRNWTEEGVGVLSLWFYGDASNAAERMYVALNGSAVVYHDNPDAALIEEWTEWRIDLQEFAAQGVNLANVNTIAIGFGDKNNLQPGGSGLVFFDDIRLYRPTP